MNASKQRKALYNTAQHEQGKFMGSKVAKSLVEKHKKKTISLRKGDVVQVMRGQFKGTKGKVERVDVGRTKVYLNEVQLTKKDGSKVSYPLHPSNLMIMELHLDDKRRLRNETSS